MRFLCALILPLAVSCSADDGARPDPTPSPSASPTRQVISAPQYSTMAKTHTPAGIREFADYFVDGISYALQTGTTRYLRTASSPSCKPCSRIAKDIENSVRAGTWAPGGAWKIERHQLRSYDPEAVITLTVAPPAALPSGDSISSFTLHLTPQKVGWVVDRMELEPR